MTKDELKQYRAVCARLSELREKRENRTRQDRVSGSSREYPYTKHSIKLTGIPSTEANIALQTEIFLLEQRKEKTERFVADIEDDVVRRVFYYRYLRGKTRESWIAIAYSVGGGNTADGVRKMHDRYLRKKGEREKGEV